jgi:hypothetical protein
VDAMRRRVLGWELGGIVFILLLGAVLHFAFEWSGEWKPLAVIAAVNESVWEHLKLGFWPALLYSAIEYRFLRGFSNNFIVARTTAAVVIPATIVALFYAYTAVVEDMLVADILIFVVAVVLGQVASYRVLRSRPLSRRLHWFAAVSLILLVLAFALLTFYAPQSGLFRDPVGGAYGIPLD